MTSSGYAHCVFWNLGYTVLCLCERVLAENLTDKVQKRYTRLPSNVNLSD